MVGFGWVEMAAREANRRAGYMQDHGGIITWSDDGYHIPLYGMGAVARSRLGGDYRDYPASRAWWTLYDEMERILAVHEWINNSWPSRRS